MPMLARGELHQMSVIENVPHRQNNCQIDRDARELHWTQRLEYASVCGVFDASPPEPLSALHFPSRSTKSTMSHRSLLLSWLRSAPAGSARRPESDEPNNGKSIKLHDRLAMYLRSHKLPLLSRSSRCAGIVSTSAAHTQPHLGTVEPHTAACIGPLQGDMSQ